MRSHIQVTISAHNITSGRNNPHKNLKKLRYPQKTEEFQVVAHISASAMYSLTLQCTCINSEDYNYSVSGRLIACIEESRSTHPKSSMYLFLEGGCSITQNQKSNYSGGT
jgi:hypothetical protein